MDNTPPYPPSTALSTDKISFGMVIVTGLYRIWRARIEVRHPDRRRTQVHVFFMESIAQIKAVQEFRENVHDWGHVL